MRTTRIVMGSVILSVGLLLEVMTVTQAIMDEDLRSLMPLGFAMCIIAGVLMVKEV